jgi:tetratricopeptide (TPR) repeat protein
MLLFLVSLLIGLQSVSQPPVLEFPASGYSKAHDEFVLGVVALHSSAYDVAAGHFRAAQRLDPNFVMAYWGEAMTFNHPFWNQQDIAGARRALAKLAPSRSARAAKAATARERAYLSAVETLYDDGDRDSRDFAFADAMRKVAIDFPQDYEAAAFYVLALLSTRRIGDASYPQKQATAAAILESILAKYPEHPGALHYLMHIWDDPAHAPQALEMARRYEAIAARAESPHAMHMPSHIYAQLGLWNDVVRANAKAFDSSRQRDYHSLDFLQYAQLQLGQYARAREALSRIPQTTEQAAVMAARFAVETGDSSVLSPFPPALQIPELLFARGLASLNTSGVVETTRLASVLDELIKADLAAGRRVRAATTDVLRKILLARIALAAKQPDEAERLGREAVEIEMKLEIPAEVSGIVKPAAEFQGEILLELKKPAAAAEQFEAALKLRPKRALSLLGLARAKAMAKDDSGAARIYTELAAMWSEADAELRKRLP